MSAQHIPGPWEFIRQGNKVVVYEARTNANDDVCTVNQYSEAETTANAHLIAAAPELLEALNLAYETLKVSYPLTTLENDQRFGIFNQIRAAIAKATGGT